MSRYLNRSVQRGFGLAAGFFLFNLVAGLVQGVTAGLWAVTEEFSPAVRIILRGVLILVGLAALIAVVIFVFSEG
jgi:hypothetical protein